MAEFSICGPEWQIALFAMIAAGCWIQPSDYAPITCTGGA